MFNIGDKVLERGWQYFGKITDISSDGEITFQPLIQFYADGTFWRTLKSAKPRKFSWRDATERHYIYTADRSAEILEQRIDKMEKSISEIQAVMR